MSSNGAPESQVHKVASTSDEQKSASSFEPEAGVLDWDSHPQNPRNWPARRKWVAISIVSFYTFVSPLATSMMAPALPDVAKQYGITNPTILALTLSIFLLSFALGPLFLAPLSEMYGRSWVLHISNLVFLAFNLGSAFAPNTGALIAFRFLAGWPGAAPIAIGGGSVSDVFSERERAAAMAIYTLGPLIGPVIGPIAGGFITQSIGVKYIFIVISALCGLAALVGIPFLKETYGPIIKLRLLRENADTEKDVQYSSDIVTRRTSKWHLLWVNLSRPTFMLTHSFICFILSLYMALDYGIYYIMFATFPEIFTDVYHFSVGVGGLAYIGLGVGFFVGTLFGAKFSNKIYTTLADRNGGGTPEMRIPSLIFGSLFVPVGLFWYGWSVEAKIHWIMPIIGTGIFGFGLITSYLPIQLYLADAFTFAASALSAAALFRSLLGFAFPLFGAKLYTTLGDGGGNSLLAGLAIVIGIPFPIWIWYKGADIRRRSSLSR